MTKKKTCVILRTPPWGLDTLSWSHITSLDLLLLHQTSCSHFFFTSVFCFKRVSIRSLHNLSCALQMCDTLSSDLLCSALCWCMQDLSTSSPQHLAHTCTSASHVSFFQILSWMPMLLQIDCQYGSWESLHDPILAKDVSSPFLRQLQSSGRIILLQQNSNLLFGVFLTMLWVLHFPTAQLRHLCSCTS